MTIERTKSLALVMPYYGKLPPYFNHFLSSLRGRDFDVLLFTDLAVGPHPANLHVLPLTFDGFRELASQKLGMTACLNSIRRLCDFKPMYGKIFEDYLTDYDYWAFGDCDMVFGPPFDTELASAIAEEVDVFSTQEHFTAGPFCMIRNDQRGRELFARADNLLEVVSDERDGCVAFDELSGDFHDEVRRGEMSLEDCRRHCDCFSSVVARQTGLKTIFKDVLYQDDLADGSTVEMSADGHLTANGRPIPAYHFIRAKLRRYFTYVEQRYECVADFVIDDAGFYVTPCQKMFRFFVNRWRKLKAALRSLRNNGVARLLPQWKRQFRSEGLHRD